MAVPVALKILEKQTLAHQTSGDSINENFIYILLVNLFVKLPVELRGETGVLKKRMDDAITTTRFTQFPTECVTGDTISKII